VAQRKGISLKKRYGQHFLRNEQYLQSMFDAVTLTDQSSVLEIGCGEGLLTRAILRHPIARLWVYEIDQEWADHVSNSIKDDRLKMHHENFLDADLDTLKPNAPWTILANLPYQVTFPILHRFAKYRTSLKEGVVMVQEEVAQKIIKTSGRGYGYPSLFFQHYFEWKLLEKVPPSAFYPPPKVFSRLLYFKPIAKPVAIPDEEDFWKFIIACFKQPRRTLRNNLRSTHYDVAKLSDELLAKRAQQLDMKELLEVWDRLRS
jgi:16S rRNA (adenine1518-N6/adenine1519-N6)-dimethyltransferase